MWILSFVPALAQGLINGDFESGDLSGWSDTSWLLLYVGGGAYQEVPWPASGEDPVLTVDPTVGRGAASARLATPYGWWDGNDFNTFTVDVRSDPFVVTHSTLSYAVIDTAATPLRVGLIPVDTLSWLTPLAVPGPPSADGFTNQTVDTAAACGVSARVRVLWDGLYDQVDTWWLDDLVESGPVCAQFVDADGDGLCPEGADGDGDGDCADPGEPQPGDRVDCDDANAAIGACLQILSHDAWLAPNAPFSVAVGGATPGEELVLVTGTGPGTTCPPSTVGSSCLDLAGPLRVIDRATADPAGTARFTVQPRRVQVTPYTTRWLQAVTARPGPVRVSAALAVPVRPERGPAADPGLTNGDLADGLTGWVAVSAVYEPGWAFDATFPCPGGGATETDRGTSLSVIPSDGCDNTTRSWPVHVTHRALSWAQRGSGELRVFDLVDGTEIPLVPLEADAPDGFTEGVADLGSACGRDVFVEVSGAEPTVWDDLTLDGPPCQELLDRNGDGRCAAGIDRDGDQACVSSGEYDPGHPVVAPLARVIEDFERATVCADPSAGCDPCPDGFDTSCIGAVTPYAVVELRAWADHPELPPLGARGLWFDDAWQTGGAIGWLPAAETELVTHEQFAVSVLATGEGDWRSAVLHVEPHGTLGEPIGAPIVTPLGTLPPRVWGQQVVDLSASCGAWVTSVDLWFEGGQMFTGLPGDSGGWASPEMLYLDDLGFTGPVCAAFVDDDGDGSCPQGIDLDGDGVCVSFGEAFGPGGE